MFDLCMGIGSCFYPTASNSNDYKHQASHAEIADFPHAPFLPELHLRCGIIPEYIILVTDVALRGCLILLINTAIQSVAYY